MESMNKFLSVACAVVLLTLSPALFAQGGPGGGGGGGGFGGGGGITGVPANSTATGPIAQVQNTGNGATITFNYNPKAATSLGTGGESDFLVQVPLAINIPPNIRVFQNNRDASARGQIMPVTININAGEGLIDMQPDYNRQRLYIQQFRLEPQRSLRHEGSEVRYPHQDRTVAPIALPSEPTAIRFMSPIPGANRSALSISRRGKSPAASCFRPFP